MWMVRPCRSVTSKWARPVWRRTGRSPHREERDDEQRDPDGGGTPFPTRRASTRKSFSRPWKRRLRRPRARSTARNGTRGSRSTARPATTTPSAAGRYSPTIPPSWRRRTANCGWKTRSTSTRMRAGRIRGRADGIGGLRPHRRDAGQAGDGAEGARGRARAGHRPVQGPREHAGLGRGQARGPQWHLRGPWQQRRRVYLAQRHDPARGAEAAGPG